MRPVIIIPARYAAERLPGKPLADICGKPMILHVWERAVAAGVGEVWVATDDVRIRDAVEGAGGQAVMTEPKLASGSDRVWAALGQIDPAAALEVVINLQGDMPTFDPAIIAPSLEPLRNPDVDIATPVCRITDEAEIESEAVVKPAVAWHDAEERQGRALYFSRRPIPSGEGFYYHHIGLYAFRRAALARFVGLPPHPLERRERLEQLRALAAGMRIDVARVDTAPLGVDTPEQLETARRLLRSIS